VVEAAKKASIHDFIESLLNGYDTKLSELGDSLIILRSLEKSKKNKTIVLVSHRKSTMNIADTVIEM